MFRRSVVVAVALLTALGLQAPGAGYAQQRGSIANVKLAKVALPWADCGFKLSATFENIGRDRTKALFAMHDAIYGSTFTHWERLEVGQVKASFKLGSGSPGGDTIDHGEVTLYRGARVIDGPVPVDTVVSCP